MSNFTFKKFEKIWNYLILGGISLIIILALTDVFITKKVELKNCLKVKEHFKEFEKVKISGKISYSYDFYTLENPEFYKVAADYSHCFDAENFYKSVNYGDEIILYINKDNGLKNPNMKCVVGIVVNNKNYVDIKCVNEQIRKNKIYMPLIFSILLIILIISIVQKRKRRVEKKPNS